MFPNILFVGDKTKTTTQWRVPIDDEHTLHMSYYVYRSAPGQSVPHQDVASYRWTPLYEADGRFFTGITFNQDYMAWVTQGPIARRDLEVLGRSDIGIILFRKQLREQMKVVADGGEPMNTFHDANVIALPMEQIKHGNLPDGRYRPGEAGESTDEELIRQAMLTWVDAADMPDEVATHLM